MTWEIYFQWSHHGQMFYCKVLLKRQIHLFIFIDCDKISNALSWKSQTKDVQLCLQPMGGKWSNKRIWDLYNTSHKQNKALPLALSLKITEWIYVMNLTMNLTDMNCSVINTCISKHFCLDCKIKRHDSHNSCKSFWIQCAARIHQVHHTHLFFSHFL